MNANHDRFGALHQALATRILVLDEATEGLAPLIRAEIWRCIERLRTGSLDPTEITPELVDLIAESHFLILPSRAEAFGIVFCEAASFGVPSLATRAGGIPTAVRDGGNGKTFPLGTPPAEYAAFIRQHFADYASYEALARSAFREYETRLNWGVSGATAMGPLRALLAKRRGASAAV